MTSLPRWLRVVFVATALVFAAVAIYVYAFRFFAWLESDAAVQVLLAEKALHVHLPIVDSWYYANGDVWFLSPHLLAIPPVAIIGPGPASLWISVVLGFAIEFGVFAICYRRLGAEPTVAIFAAMVTLAAWSNAHVAYEYIQLAYGYVTCLYVASFAWAAVLVTRAVVKPWQLVGFGVFVALIAQQNPTRAVVYDLLPVLAACAWPWRTVPLRRRVSIGIAALAGWIAAFAIYAFVVLPSVELSVPRGHLAYAFGSPLANLEMFGRGIVLLCGGGRLGVLAIPGVVLLIGAALFVTREVLASREVSAMRFVCVIVVGQLGIVLVPLVVGNLLDGREAIRYVMPSLLVLLGLTAVIAVRTATEGAGVWRRVAMAWLVVVPVTLVAVAVDAKPPRPRKYIWPDAAELSAIADELVHRNLTHGFSINLAANLVTLDSGGAVHACPVVFRHVMMPQRWLASTSCYDSAALPDRFFVITYRTDEADRAAVHATLPPPVEHFTAGDTYDVFVFGTRDGSLAWLDLPVPDGELATFPIRLPATHAQIRRDHAVVTAGDVVATGEPGTVVSGPFVALPKGDYDASWIGNQVEATGQLELSVRADGKPEPFARVIVDAKQLPATRGELARLSFKLERAWNGVELNVDSSKGGRVAVHELVIERKR